MSINAYRGLSGSCGSGPLPGVCIKSFTKIHVTEKSKKTQGVNHMAKGMFQKSIRISEKPKKTSPQTFFVEGSKQTQVSKPKSLTPGTRKK